MQIQDFYSRTKTLDDFVDIQKDIIEILHILSNSNVTE